MAFRRIVVTGGNKGIGLAVCSRILKDHPDTFVLLGSRDEKRGQHAVQSILEKLPGSEGRIEMLHIDVSDDNSVSSAAELVASKYEQEPSPLYGIINNAGIGFGKSIPETINTNFFGTRRVSEAFIPLLQPNGGRVVNIASASGPMFVQGLEHDEKKPFVDPATTMDELSAVIEKYCTLTDYDGIAYGLSKACVNVYTRQLAQQYPDLCINACTPGYILTDLTRGMGATKPPSEGTAAPLYCLMAKLEGNGRYYGSDCVRSPLDRYRGPGDPPYVGP